MEEVADVPATQEENKIASAVNLLQDNNGGTSGNGVAGQMIREKEQPTYNLICNRLEITNKSSPHSLGKVNSLQLFSLIFLFYAITLNTFGFFTVTFYLHYRKTKLSGCKEMFRD